MVIEVALGLYTRVKVVGFLARPMAGPPQGIQQIFERNQEARPRTGVVFLKWLWLSK